MNVIRREGAKTFYLVSPMTSVGEGDKVKSWLDLQNGKLVGKHFVIVTQIYVNRWNLSMPPIEHGLNYMFKQKVI